MRSDPCSAADRDRLLDRLKTRYEPGAMRPQLYQSAEPLGHGQEALRFHWMFYAGMGDVAFHPASADEQRAATELLDSGYIVATPASTPLDGLRLMERVNLIEDLNWGITAGGQPITFTLSDKPGGRDHVIKMDEYSPAITELRNRLRYDRAYADKPIVLNDGTPVVPIQFEKQEAILRKRQDALTPQMN